jgi:hypothetical protein
MRRTFDRPRACYVLMSAPWEREDLAMTTQTKDQIEKGAAGVVVVLASIIFAAPLVAVTIAVAMQF